MLQPRDKTGFQAACHHATQAVADATVFPDCATYDRLMAVCEAGWRTTGDPWAVSTAHSLAVLHRQISPPWLEAAIYSLAYNKRRTAKALGKRAREAMIRFWRFSAVRDAHDVDGLTWEQACVKASEVLTGTFASAQADTMWRAYKAVKRDLNAGQDGQYWEMKSD